MAAVFQQLLSLNKLYFKKYNRGINDFW